MELSALIDGLVVFLPLLGAMAAGLGGRRLGDGFAQIVTCGAVGLAALLSCFVFYEVGFASGARETVLMTWIEAGSLSANWSLRVDTVSAIMMLVVTSVSAMVHLYAVGYMHEDKGVPRFMSLLSLFTFFMLMLVTAGNFLQLFFGWEGVGLASYLLIGFWYNKPSASVAGMKAFWLNRVGDFGFLLGIFACFQLFGSLDFDVVFKNAAQHVETKYSFGQISCHALTVVSLLLFIGAMGKSAQIGLHTWLPDAMEGPTPVSALIHAATMVTAGVFMVARLSPLFEYAPVALAVVAVVGALTALMAGSIGLTQFDIKRVIAYSTMSQLGYMFFAAGVSAYGAALFHLMTHAFFKALLFLSAGCVIHALAGEQDLRKMGGLGRKMPLTCGLMWIGSLSLAGIGIGGAFGFAGAYSKDMILVSAYAHGSWYGYMAYALGVFTAFVTAFYSWRLLVLAFHGDYRGDPALYERVHEPNRHLMWPLLPLATGAVFAGAWAQDWFAGAYNGPFWKDSLYALASPANGPVPAFAHYAPLIVAVAGLLMAGWIYLRRPALPARIAGRLGVFYRLVSNKYYFDILYETMFVRPALRLGSYLWHKGDEETLDRFGPDGVASVSRRFGQKLRLIQTGYLVHYMAVMIGGFLLLWGFALMRGG